MLAIATQNGYKVASTSDAGATSMPKMIDLTFEEMSEMLAYDPDTGKIVWRVTPSRRIKAGEEAGVIKHTNQKSANLYRYITLRGVSTPAARIAWLLYYGEWPTVSIKYKDDDSLNLRIDNLELARFPAVPVLKEGRRVYRMSKDAQRHYGRMRYYGMSGEEYDALFAAQDGKCSICRNPETAIYNGEIKQLHVDHDHATGTVRALLCGACNGMLGLARDNPETLRAAAKYIEDHAAKVQPMRRPDEVA
jgi:hypothetical protein